MVSHLVHGEAENTCRSRNPHKCVDLLRLSHIVVGTEDLTKDEYEIRQNKGAYCNSNRLERFDLANVVRLGGLVVIFKASDQIGSGSGIVQTIVDRRFSRKFI